ncbi:MAG: YHS domain-containing protein [Desulfobaccales bacterium]
MRKFQAVILALALAAFAAGSLWAADPKPQTVCPVRGDKIDKSTYVDYQGKRIYFCCEGCDKDFKKDPEKYLKKMQDEGVTPEPTPAGAPKK